MTEPLDPVTPASPDKAAVAKLPQTFEPEGLVALLENHVGTLVDGRAALLTLLGTAHRLSLYLDEGRPLVGGMLLTEGSLPPLTTWWMRGAHRADFAGLKALLPIAASRSSCLCVSWGRSPGRACSDISAIGPWPARLGGLGTSGPYLIEILAPGCLALSAGTCEVRFERDEYHAAAGEADVGAIFSTVDAGPLAAFFTPASSPTELRSGHSVDDRRWREHADKTAEVAASVAFALLGRGTLEVLRAVRRLAHGGIVLIEREAVPLGVDGDSGSRDPLYGALFSGECSFRRMPDGSHSHRTRGLVDLLGWMIMDEIFRQRGVRLSWSTFDRQCTTDESWHRTVVLERMDAATQKMRSDARRIASRIWLAGPGSA